MDYNEEYFKSLQQYQAQIIEGAITKIQNGAKTIIIAMPVGYGKTTVIQKIAEELFDEKAYSVLFIVKYRNNKDQLKKRIGEVNFPYRIATCSEIIAEAVTDNFRLPYNYIFVDDLRIAERRQLTRLLKGYSGSVVSTTCYPFGSQEVKNI